MALCIDSTAEAFLEAVKATLNTLTGPNALTYRQERYRPFGRMVERVLPGWGINAAVGNHPHSVTLIRRIIESAHWVRIVAGGNSASPDKWLKDAVWSGIKKFASRVDPDRGFMNKVMTTGSSAVVRWRSIDMQTSDLSPVGKLQVDHPVPAYICLAHELVHADRIMRGKYQRGQGKSTFLVDQRQNLDGTHLYQQSASLISAKIIDGGQHLSFTEGGKECTVPRSGVTDLQNGRVWVMRTDDQVEELLTIGLNDDNGIGTPDPMAITENMIRAEHHIWRRLKYGRCGAIIADQ